MASFNDMLDTFKILLKELVACPSVSNGSMGNSGIIATKDKLAHIFTHLGFETEIIETAKHPIVLAQRLRPQAPHLLFYAHYDVQPADNDGWDSHPFELVEKDGRLYGRGASDNKGPLAVMLTAISQLLKEDPEYPLSLSFVVEGEEEIGSPNFAHFLQQHKDRLQADAVILSDTLSLGIDKPVITTGLRGMQTFELVLHGPLRDLHSGLFGGTAVNPIHALCNLCASLHDADGKVNIPGFYDNVVEPSAKECAQLPDLDDRYKTFIGNEACLCPDGMTPTQTVRFQPTLEINGIGGGYQGAGCKTVIPECAWAKISCRLVPDQTPASIATLVGDTVKTRLPRGTRLEIKWQGSTEPYFMPNDETSWCQIAVKNACKETFGTEPIFMRDGGSIGIVSSLHAQLGCEVIMLGLSLAEDAIHSNNESFSLKMAERGIQCYVKFLELCRDTRASFVKNNSE